MKKYVVAVGFDSQTETIEADSMSVDRDALFFYRRVGDPRPESSSYQEIVAVFSRQAWQSVRAEKV